MESIKRFLTVSWPYLAAAAGAALLTVVFITLQKKDRPNQTVDSFLAPAPDFSLHSIDGEPIRSTDLRGKVIVINFWATWWGGCADFYAARRTLVTVRIDRGDVKNPIRESP